MVSKKIKLTFLEVIPNILILAIPGLIAAGIGFAVGFIFFVKTLFLASNVLVFLLHKKV